MLLLDASVWVAALDKDDRFYASARRVATMDSAVAALDLTLYEVANAVTRRWGNPTPAAAAVRAVLRACGQRLTRIDADTIVATVELAAEHDLTAYDAAYVAVARSRDWTLVSTDIADLVERGLALAPDDPAVAASPAAG